MIRCLSAAMLLALLPSAAPLARSDDKKDAPKSETRTDKSDEQKLLELINKERAKKKVPPLRPNPTLSQVARRHSANMAKQGKMEHVLDGKNPGQRVLDAGYDWGKISENIAVSEAPGAPLPQIVKGWMDSEIHRKNLLDDRVTETGLGIAKSDKGEVYYTQLFARPRKVIKKPKTR